MGLLSSSCFTLYKPNIVNSPLLNEKGEGNITAGLGISGSGLANLQGAYAYSDNKALMLNLMVHSRRTDSVNNGNSQHLLLYFGEVGIGYFKNLNKSRTLLFQNYGGIGLGSSSDKIIGGTETPSISANYATLFIQPGVAITSRNIDLALDIRGNFVQMFNVNGYLYERFDWWNTDFILHKDTSYNFINIEPALTIRAGDSRVKGFLQLGAILPVYNPNNYFVSNSESYMLLPLIKLSLGLTYQFGRKKD